MKRIGFIGIYDKIDMILNIAKILTAMSKEVLVVDSSISQKARYIVPAISPTVSYITSFEDIDVAVGFNNLEEIKKYVGVTKELPYDVVLIDADTVEKIESFELEKSERNYFVTSFDVYSLKKGLEILAKLKNPLNLTKILYSKEMSKEEDDYLNFLSLGYKIVWSDVRIYFPIENGDLSVITENQRVQKIKLRRLSAQNKDSLIYITQQILEEKTDSNVRRIVKALEKGE
jgi:hypothetical protein